MGQRASDSAAVIGGGLRLACVLPGGGIRRAGTVGLWGYGYVGIPTELWVAVGGRQQASGQAVEVGVDHAARLLSLKPLPHTRDRKRDGASPRAAMRNPRVVIVYVARPLEIMAIDPTVAAGRYVAHWDPAWGLVVDLATPVWLTSEAEGYGRGIPYEVNVRKIEGAERRAARQRGERLVQLVPGRGIESLSAWREDNRSAWEGTPTAVGVRR